MKRADIILNVTEDENFIKTNKKQTEWLILNKIDKKKLIRKEFIDKTIPVSAKTGEGLNLI